MKYKFYLILFLSQFLFVIGCKLNSSKHWIDDNINPSIRSQISELDAKVLGAFKNKDISILENIIPNEIFQNNKKNIEQLLNENYGAINNLNFDNVKQFYIKSSNLGTLNHVMTGINDVNDYSIQYMAINKETYISLIVPEHKLKNVVFTLVYGKYNDDWKLNTLKIGPYKLDNKTAPQFYQEAKNDFDNSSIVDAANKMYLCLQIINPANELFHYNKEKEMKEFYDEIMEKIRTSYTFPLTFENIPTKPKVLNIYPKEMSEGIFPMIEYLTTINLNDTVNTKKENLLIQRNIGDVFNGIDKNKKYIFYKAFNEMPNSSNPVYSFGFVQEIKE